MVLVHTGSKVKHNLSFSIKALEYLMADERIIPSEGIVLVIVIEGCPASAAVYEFRSSRGTKQGDAGALPRRAAQVDEQPLLLLLLLVPPLVLLASRACSRAVVPRARRADR